MIKQIHWIVLLISAGIFLGSYIISQESLTGLVVFDDDVLLKVDKPLVYATESVISWRTTLDSTSTFTYGSDSIAYSPATAFSRVITGLQPETEYVYIISACAGEKCEEKQVKIMTPSAPTPPQAITGAVVGVVPQTIQSTASLILYLLLGTVVLAVAGRIGYEKITSNQDPMKNLIGKANKLMENEQHEDAYQTYIQARKIFSQLETEAKVKHYDGLIKIYQSLKRYAEIKEAQKLTEKYTQGSITSEEIKKLNDMFAR